MGFCTDSTHAYVDLGDWSGSTCAINPATCQQGLSSTSFENSLWTPVKLIKLYKELYLHVED